MQESTATIKLTKSEIEWTIISLVFAQNSAEHFTQWDDAKMYEKIRKDFTNIKDDIIEGEKQLETQHKIEEETENSPGTCD
tara:strand:+ start:908 stop:1150 length:243 start_codon:yes stop_codon:yes gene_type:complete